MAAEHVSTGDYAGNKPEYVRQMFAGIAGRYDLLNSILSFSRHRAWRRTAVRLAHLCPGDSALDVCAGTGDFAIDLYREVGPTGRVIGADFCAPMIHRGLEKTRRASNGRIRLMIADALRLPYRSGTFDCCTVGFGIRNVADIPQAFREMARVVRKGGRVVCLEFSRPRSRLYRAVCDAYQSRVLPMIGGLLSRRDAYTYLPESIQSFHSREELAAMMQGAGLEDVRVLDLNLGSVCIHMGTRA